MLRSIAAVFAGYLTMVVGVVGFDAFLLVVFSDVFSRKPGPYEGPAWILVLELVAAALIAGVGGWVCGWIARRAEVGHALVLGGLMLVLSIVSLVGEAGWKPLWSSIAMAVLPPLAMLYGARLRAEQAHG